jgi:large subunit ribosomal protein L17
MAVLRSESCALIKHGKIKCTLTRAKEARRFVERLISLSKRSDLSARRLIFSRLRDKSAVKSLFEMAGRFEGRPGGFTRISRIGFRRGDATPMAMLELV